MMDYALSYTTLDVADMLALGLATSKPLLSRPRVDAMLAGFETFRFGPANSRVGWSIGAGPVVLLGPKLFGPR